MADNIAVTAGTGTTIAADEVSDGTLGSVKVQYVKIMDGTLDGTNKAAVGSNGVASDVKASVLPTGASTSANQSTGNTSLATIATNTGNIPASPSTAAKQPALGTAGTAASDVISVQGIASMTKLLVTPDLPTGASTAAKQPALGTAGSASSDVLTIQGVASMTKLLVTPDLPSGAATSANQSTSNTSLSNIDTSTAASKTDLDTLAGAVSSSKVNVNISSGGNTQYTDTATPPTNPVGNAIAWEDVDDAVWKTVSNSNPLPATLYGTNEVVLGGTPDVNIANSYTSGTISTRNLAPTSVTATANSTVYATVSHAYSTVTLQVVGTYTGALTGQITQDNSNVIDLGGTPFHNINTGVYSATIPSGATGIYIVNVAGAFKFRISANAAFTGSADITLNSSLASSLVAINNPLPTGSNAIGSVTANASTNKIGDVDIAPRTTGGWSVGNFNTGDTFTALTNTAQVIKAAAGKFGGYYIYNPNAAVSYVMVYDIAAASVTVGTSTAKLVFAIPPYSAANLELLAGIPFATAMSCAAATTGGGNTAPTTALEAMIWYV